MVEWLNGKKTILGALLLALLGVVYNLDLLIDPENFWISEERYVAIGTFVAGLTGVAMRLGVAKSGPTK